MTKITITIPEAELRALESIRRRQRIPRSRLIQHAVSFYLGHTDLSEDVRAYEKGYRRQPEQERTLDAYARAAAEVLGREEWT